MTSHDLYYVAKIMREGKPTQTIIKVSEPMKAMEAHNVAATMENENVDAHCRYTAIEASCKADK